MKEGSVHVNGGPVTETAPPSPDSGAGGSAPERVWVVGADGGGSGLRLVLTNPEHTRTARREGGPPAAIGTRSNEALARLLVEEVRALLREEGVTEPLAAFCAGLAGAGSREEAAELEARIAETGIAREVIVVPDSLAAYWSVFALDPGIVLMSGTGSIGMAIDPDAALLRCGGWGPILSDEGSGYHIAIEGLRTVLRGQEGRGYEGEEGTALQRALMEAIGAEDAHDIVSWVAGSTREQIAALAPLVVQEAARDDRAAIRLVAFAVAELCNIAECLRVQLRARWGEEPGDPDDAPVALGGGLLMPGRPLHDLLRSELHERGFRVVPQSPDGTRGAGLIALVFRDGRDPFLG